VPKGVATVRLSDGRIRLAEVHWFEAHGRISEEFQTSHPEIPWKEIKAIRVILAHRYGDVDLHELWQAVQRDLPDLLPKLDVLVPLVDNT
jgi:uncharacterized protein with HEPN domain